MVDATATMSGANEDRRTAAEAVEITATAATTTAAAAGAGNGAPEAESTVAARESATTTTTASAAAAAGKETMQGEEDKQRDGEAASVEEADGNAAVAAAAGTTVGGGATGATTAADGSEARDRSDSLAIEHNDEHNNDEGGSAHGVVCNITLLLPTGARHPYRIDEKYLAKRNVDVPGTTESGEKDPFSISVYKLKELILREWREEWESKPASPSSIRLIHFGKLLEDKEPLTTYHFSAEAPNVVHMSVKPAEMMEEDEASKGKSGGRDSRTREGGGGCCVIL